MRIFFTACTVVFFAACGVAPASKLASSGFSESVEVLAPLPPPKPVTKVLGHTKLVDINDDPKIVEVNLTAKPTQIELSPSRTVSMLTYNGVFPGPLLEANVGDRVIVHFKNELAEATTIHWHGFRISDTMDGNPRIQTPVPPGGTFVYDFVVPEAGSFWYHPHLNVHQQLERGLYGPIIVRGPEEPTYEIERYFVIDDIALNGNVIPNDTDFGKPPEGIFGRYGDVFLINGKESTTGQKDTVGKNHFERWRLVNTANTRTMEVSIKGAVFRVIGTDGGLLELPYVATKLLMPVGRRFDLEVYFNQVGPAVLQTTDELSSTGKDQVSLFTINVTTDTETVPLPVWTVPPMTPRTANKTAALEFDFMFDQNNNVVWMVNGKAHNHDPVLTFKKGDTVALTLRNLAPMTQHPFHLHGQFFTVISGAGSSVEPGLKDTVRIPPGGTVQVLAYMDNPGMWMAHCHILEHAELGMMATIKVDP